MFKKRPTLEDFLRCNSLLTLATRHTTKNRLLYLKQKQIEFGKPIQAQKSGAVHVAERKGPTQRTKLDRFVSLAKPFRNGFRASRKVAFISNGHHSSGQSSRIWDYCKVYLWSAYIWQSPSLQQFPICLAPEKETKDFVHYFLVQLLGFLVHFQTSL